MVPGRFLRFGASGSRFGDNCVHEGFARDSLCASIEIEEIPGGISVS
jgi:hypothetical protein